MRLSKKQAALMGLIKKCGYIFRNQVNEQQYPKSVVDSLINKGLIVEHKNRLAIPPNKPNRVDGLGSSIKPIDTGDE